MTLGLVLAFVLTFADSTQAHYADKNADALRAMWERTDDRADRLLLRYRLYPLTEDERYLADLAADLDDGTARELALLAGLWGYRAAGASLPLAVRYGLRSSRLLDRAAALDPAEPFVLLIRGQSLLFRPSIWGGDDGEALRCFTALRTSVATHDGSGVSPWEADLWHWYTLRRLRPAEAERERARLLERHPPRLYREFLQAPLVDPVRSRS